MKLFSSNLTALGLFLKSFRKISKDNFWRHFSRNRLRNLCVRYKGILSEIQLALLSYKFIKKDLQRIQAIALCLWGFKAKRTSNFLNQSLLRKLSCCQLELLGEICRKSCEISDQIFSVNIALPNSIIRMETRNFAAKLCTNNLVSNKKA